MMHTWNDMREDLDRDFADFVAISLVYTRFSRGSFSLLKFNHIRKFAPYELLLFTLMTLLVVISSIRSITWSN